MRLLPAALISPPPSNSLECIAAAEDGELELATTEPEPGQAAAHASESSSGGGSGGAGATPLSAEAANTTAALPSAAGEGVEEQLQRLRIAAREGDGLMEQLAAKYGCSSSGSGGNSADGCARRAAPRCTACAVWQHCGHRLPAQLAPNLCGCHTSRASAATVVCRADVPQAGWLLTHAHGASLSPPPLAAARAPSLRVGPAPKMTTTTTLSRWQSRGGRCTGLAAWWRLRCGMQRGTLARGWRSPCRQPTRSAACGSPWRVTRRPQRRRQQQQR